MSRSSALIVALAASLLPLAAAPPARADDPAPAPLATPAAVSSVKGPHIEVALVAETTSAKPGAALTLGLRFRMEPHWHVYWKNPGDSGTAPTVAWRLPAGARASGIRWPAPTRLYVASLAAFAYEDEVVLPVEVTLPSDLPVGTATFTADVEWLVCREECVPGDATLTLTIPISDARPAADPQHSAGFAETRARLPERLPAGIARATREDKTFALRLTGPGPWTDPASRLELFPDDDVLVNAAPQVVARHDTVTALLLPRELSRSRATSALKGLLVVSVGAARAAYEVDAPVGPAGDELWLRPTTPSSDLSFALALFLAFLGGIVLNLMPCVLPVLSLKVLGFVERAGESPALVRRHGWVYGAGVLASFGALAAILLVLRAGGEGVGWGFQLQDPRFVAILCLIMAGLGASLLGAIDLGSSLGRLGGGSASGYTASFLGGVLATVVATPCTGPFMGPALGFALTRPAIEAVAILLSLGVGMAAPYVLLATFPAWLRIVPRPGAWMDTMKRATAFPLVATAIWLAWVLGQQNGVDGMALVLGAALVLSLGLWMLGHYGAPHRSTLVRLLAGWGLGLGLVAVAVLGGLRAARSPPPPLPWEPWSEARVAEATSAGKTVLVDFTADWCLTCKAYESTVLASDEVRAAVAKHGVVLLKADWTRRDAKIAAALERFGRASVPLYVVHAPGGRAPVAIPMDPFLTVELVLSALDEAGK